jgi:hypothetical protein
VTGGTGFIGSRLIRALVAAGHNVTVLTRNAKAAAHLPVPIRIVTALDQLASDERIDAVVNLAGEPIANSPWTASKRERIISSRVSVTEEVGRLFRRLEAPPRTLVSGSAIGWYGVREAEALTEESESVPCFTRDVCTAWEAAAEKAAAKTTRLVILRIGLVLGRDGGMLARMLTPFEFGLGGPFGSGRQIMSWIHIDDLIRLIVRAIADEQFTGIVNATAPGPIDNRAFTAELGRALGRPALIPVPAAPLRLALGDFADELLLGGQSVLPAKAQKLGFQFEHPDLRSALSEIAGNTPALNEQLQQEDLCPTDTRLLQGSPVESWRRHSPLPRQQSSSDLS